MDKLVACGVIESSEDVACIGSAVLVEGQEKGQVYRFFTDHCHKHAVSTQHVYLQHSILGIVYIKKRGDL